MIEQLDQSPGESATKVFAQNQQFFKIKDQYQKIQTDFAAIDRQWIASNASLGIDIGNFAHDGALYYCIVSCRGQIYLGGAAISLSAGREFVLAEQLRKDITTIQRLAADLQAANRE